MSIIVTTKPLAGGETFTQPAMDRFQPHPLNVTVAFYKPEKEEEFEPIGAVQGICYADAAGTLYLEESDDKVNWTTTKTISVSAKTTTELPWTNLSKRWYRFKYTNGGTAQTNFVLSQQSRSVIVTPTITELTGSVVTIGEKTFAVSGGDTLRGKSVDKPDAAAAHTAIPYCYYFSIDTGTVEVTNGVSWVVI